MAWKKQRTKDSKKKQTTHREQNSQAQQTAPVLAAEATQRCISSSDKSMRTTKACNTPSANMLPVLPNDRLASLIWIGVGITFLLTIHARWQLCHVALASAEPLFRRFGQFRAAWRTPNHNAFGNYPLRGLRCGASHGNANISSSCLLDTGQMGERAPVGFGSYWRSEPGKDMPDRSLAYIIYLLLAGKPQLQ